MYIFWVFQIDHSNVTSETFPFKNLCLNLLGSIQFQKAWDLSYRSSFHSAQRSLSKFSSSFAFCIPEGQDVTDGKKALYHCNYCNKDISGKIRIKCVMCSDFDLCVECFSVGAEVHPHKSNHPYRVMVS